MKSSKVVFRRCRPQLGTFVEITLVGQNFRQANDLFNIGYAKIAQVEKLMSFHDKLSRLSKLNVAPVGDWVYVGKDLGQVLRVSLKIQKLSQHEVNVAVGTALVSWGHLPGERRPISWNDISTYGFEVKGKYARRLKPVALDLGGIAKGFAVDKAVDHMKSRCPRISGVVNAGGDLRVFGTEAMNVMVRKDSTQGPAYALKLKNASLATSEVIRNGRYSVYASPSKGCSILRRKAAVVIANKCLYADALTKVAILLPPAKARRIIKKFGAEMRVFK